MKSLIFFPVFTAAASVAQAQNAVILRCKATNAEWKASAQLDSVGAGLLEFTKAGDSTAYACALKLNQIYDGQHAVAPIFRIEFTRAECDPELTPALDGTLSQKLTLIIDLPNTSKPTGVVQWLRTKQPDDCVVEKMNLFDLQLNAKRWKAGNWARGTASMPPRSKKSK